MTRINILAEMFYYIPTNNDIWEWVRLYISNEGNILVKTQGSYLSRLHEVNFTRRIEINGVI
jgi:hypothetical protein